VVWGGCDSGGGVVVVNGSLSELYEFVSRNSSLEVTGTCPELQQAYFNEQ
jgi:hypothetical protein